MLKRCYNKDMDQLSFCIFPTNHGLKMEQYRLGNSTTKFFENAAVCKFDKRLSKTLAFYPYPQLPRKCFWYYYSRNDSSLHRTFLTPYRTFQNAFEPRKTSQFCHFHSSVIGLEKAILRQSTEPFKLLEKPKTSHYSIEES